VGLGLVVGGLVSAMVGSPLERPAVSEEDAARMVADYNRKLRVHLGLPPMEGAWREGPLLGLSLRGPW
jgi:hypothetical protein